MVCNDKCGCPVPCPGGVACGCGPNKEGATASAGGHDKNKAGCCNPCSCTKNTAASGRSDQQQQGSSCKCGPGCSCPSCAA